jgi:hypothetical protein
MLNPPFSLGWPRPSENEIYERLAIATPLIDGVLFTTDGKILLAYRDPSEAGEILINPDEFEMVQNKSVHDYIVEYAKDSALRFRRLLQILQAKPAVFRVTTMDTMGVGKTTLVARTRDHVVDWCRRQRFQYLDVMEDTELTGKLLS